MSHVARAERFVRCTLALQNGAVVTAGYLMEHFGVSAAQAKRDLNEIERLLPVHRDNGRLRILPPGGGRMRRIDAQMAFVNPDAVLVELKVTMSLGDWKALRDQLDPSHFPSWPLRAMVTDLIAATEARSYAQRELPAP